MFRKLNQKGFTLIELLVVIAIIGILSTMAVVALTSANTKARDAKRQSDLKVMQTAIEMYATDHGNPPPLSTWTALGTALANYLPGGLPEDPSGTPRDWCYCVAGGASPTGKYLIATSLERSQAVASDIDSNSAAILATYGALYANCVCSDVVGAANPPAALDCQDSGSGTVDNNASTTAVCLGSV
ncbi:MAG: type II secretion system protein [Patescibacteria group bacterium]|nr:type II secretion system protein [Patescibacteria group bacterium]